ncbi:MAG: hypothetical protein AAF571_02910 [Verrucomicrobiota bacterium]
MKLAAQILASLLMVTTSFAGIGAALGLASIAPLWAIIPFIFVLALCLAVNTYLCWLSVYHLKVPSPWAILIPNLPYLIVFLFTLPAVFTGLISPLILWGVPLILSIFLCYKATLHAEQSH